MLSRDAGSTQIEASNPEPLKSVQWRESTVFPGTRPMADAPEPWCLLRRLADMLPW